MLEVTMLGSGGTIPFKFRPLASMYVQWNRTGILIDCGEGTLVSAMEQKISVMNIDIICITHRHADHVLGLAGLLTTINNYCREIDSRREIVIIAPIDAQKTINRLRSTVELDNITIVLHWLTGFTERLCFGALKIIAVKLSHSVPCYGYRLEEHSVGHFNPEKAERLPTEREVISLLQHNVVVETKGEILDLKSVNDSFEDTIVVGYATDTSSCKGIYKIADGANLCVLEGMYAQRNSKRSQNVKHMTFEEAARIAEKSGAAELWLTHFNPSLTNPEEFLSVATEIFPATQIGYAGMRKCIGFVKRKE